MLTMGKPIFFVQKRIGKDGVHFGIIKFRTMINHAEKSGTGLDSFLDDPRVTPFGKFLRISSLDELPQVFNILKGAEGDWHISNAGLIFSVLDSGS